MPWTAEIHSGVPGALLQPCTSCGSNMYDFALLPTKDRLCIRCVCEELAKAEDEIEVDQARRFEGTTKPG